mgnify:CR=1 FL=1
MKNISTEELLLSHILHQGPISRRELQTITTLSWGSVSSATAELLRREIICESKDAVSSPGRSPGLLMANPSRNLCLGIDVNLVGYTFVICDLAGNILEKRFLPIAGTKKDEVLSLLFKQTQDLIGRFGSLFSISISMQGTVDRVSGVSVRAPQLTEWDHVPLCALFAERFGVPVRLYHDPDCLMNYHVRRTFSPGIRNAVVLRLDSGVGMSLLINRSIYEGAGNAGEIGHTVVCPGGQPCTCGKAGCLEAYASESGMALRAGVSPAVFRERLEKEDPEALRLLSECGSMLGITAANLFLLLDPDILCLDGSMTRFYERFRPHFLAEIPPYLRERIFIAPCRNESAPIGAVLRTVDELAAVLLDQE